jgi:hypothetical protein
LEVVVWTLIGVVIAGGGVATALILHGMNLLGDRIDLICERIDLICERIDLICERIDGVGNAHTHDRVA